MEGSGALVEDIRACGDDAARTSVAEGFVAARLSIADAGEDAVVRRCVERLATPGEDSGVSIEALATEMGVHRRQLERRFAERVGVSPRTLAGILRLRRFFDQLDLAGAPLVDAALAAGYYDQSHFAREFRRYAGVTASEFLATRPTLATAIFDVANVQARRGARP